MLLESGNELLRIKLSAGDVRRSETSFRHITLYLRAMRCRLPPRRRDLNCYPLPKKSKNAFGSESISEEPRSNSLHSTRRARSCTGIASPRHGSTTKARSRSEERRVGKEC